MSTNVVQIDELCGGNVLRDFEYTTFARRMKLIVAVWKEEDASTDGPGSGSEITVKWFASADVVAWIAQLRYTQSRGCRRSASTFTSAA